MNRHASRKFIVTMYFGTACFLLCYLGHLSGGDCVAAVGILSGLYKAANIIDGRKGP